MLESRGAQALPLPLQTIEAVRQPAAAARALEQAAAADAWIFTSANAVQFAQRLMPGDWPPLFAVGSATAAALLAQGRDVDLPDGAYSSEGLLALPALQSVQGRRYAIVTGEGGRELLASALRARGAQVDVIAVYRRIALPYAPAMVAQVVGDADAAIVTSGEALTRLVDLLSETPARATLQRLPLVVPSQRVVEHARQLGFRTTPMVPDQVADSAFVQCLEQWHRS
nr:uroporphyrinogen-III synthase [Solimonas marina]